ncbi:YebC/PmpR family DNA-binding transcriptional regulator [candidate division WOR-3 bacterium]|nr:YebC/PmpR family DNA-binding transcriptional regulator [candidate division WOR-3 bacterium]
MSGHSKWHQIRHKKAKVDARKGQIFTKLIREIVIAAREGGGDPESNYRLRHAIDAAKAQNMPWENIEKAIKRGTGELPGQTIEEVSYEGYGPGGVAILVEAATDNKNRTTSEIRHLFSKYGGNLGTSGCVAWIFHQKGIIHIQKDAVDEEKIFEIAIEAGAEDITTEGDYYEITTDPKSFHSVKQAIEEAGIPVEEASLTKIPQTTVKLEGDRARSLLKLMDALEEHPDVQNVYANFDIPDSILMEASKD